MPDFTDEELKYIRTAVSFAYDYVRTGLWEKGKQPEEITAEESVRVYRAILDKLKTLSF